MTDAPPDTRRAQRTHRRFSRRRRRRLTVTATVAILLAAGGYATAAAAGPLPELQPVLTVDAEQTMKASTRPAKALVEDQDLPTAIGWGDGTKIWSNDSEAYPIASITKLVTVLVALEEQPLDPGEDGPVYTYSAADQQREAELRAQDAIMYPVPVGTEFTTRELLELILLPSANDYAIAYANWVFGDNESFIAAVDAWADAHGLESLTLVEPSGLSSENRASAADLVRIARIALRHETVLDFTGMERAEVPGVGLIETTNPLFDLMSDIVGFKTGSTTAAGYNLLSGRKTEVGDREMVTISATLARPSREARAASGYDTNDAMAGMTEVVVLALEDEELGYVTTWQGERIPIVGTAGADGTLVPGERTTRTITVRPIDGEAAGGAVIGEIAFDGPIPIDPVDIATTAPITEPDFWWRISHPGEVFGWN
ncbi:D-alanyl-D-alanine carboxypeptidase family protein [Leucobacter soli]|uniref:Peptidase S11 D-alanyl-D-alanine carboxypeptidase A N-terminal domain-containing protein n=1 Tax=Leucobacter soli TaxID=2812850 RepID=A0A916JXF5_9MICO|nr:hypothetical protein [Leucobacter soli]CAG7611935.1 hypothetical protein LEUCIP111803_01504 [Leucobacter soli]